MQYLLTISVLVLLGVTNSFLHNYKSANAIKRYSSTLYALDDTIISRLDEMKNKYDRLTNVDSTESDTEAAKLKETVEKYQTYIEIKKLMSKLKTMYKDEASESRKARQLKSFVDLYRGKLQLEEILKEKLGLPYKKTNEIVADGLTELEKIDSEIKSLEEALKNVEMVLPTGMSTREERFGK